MVKTVVGLNIPYFLNHAEEIINDTSALLPEMYFGEIRSSKEHYPLYHALRIKHLHESGNWYAFGRGQFFRKKGEPLEEACSRVAREYCEKTGRWDLFIWNE